MSSASTAAAGSASATVTQEYPAAGGSASGASSAGGRSYTIRLSEANVALDKLMTIFLRYQDWEDHLSVRLLKWISKVVETRVDEIPASQEALFQEEVNVRIRKLTQKILVNHLTEKPLQKPLRVGEWTWEKRMLDVWRDVSAASPFDLQPMAESEQHFLAEEMLAWLRSYGLEAPAEPIIDFPPEERFVLYVMLAQNAKVREAQRTGAAILSDSVGRMQQLRTEILRDVAANVARLEQKLATSETEYKALIKQMESTNQTAMTTFSTQVAQLDQQRKQEASQLQTAKEQLQKANATITRQNKSIKDLGVDVSNVRKQYANARSEVEKVKKEAQRKTGRRKYILFGPRK